MGMGELVGLVDGLAAVGLALRVDVMGELLSLADELAEGVALGLSVGLALGY